MHERKASMAKLSDAFIALPGGKGTCEGIFEVWTGAQLGTHAKPCAVLNVHDFYDKLLGFLDQVVDKAFLKLVHRGMLLASPNPRALLDLIAGYKCLPKPSGSPTMNVDTVWPRVGCGAAITKDDRLLLVQRRRDPEAGCWGLPGGKVDPFEPVVDSAAREIYEELGIVIRPSELLCLVDQIDRTQGHHWIAPVFLVTYYEGTPAIMEPDALSDLGWFEVGALPADLTEATKQAVAAMKR